MSQILYIRNNFIIRDYKYLKFEKQGKYVDSYLYSTNSIKPLLKQKWKTIPRIENSSNFIEYWVGTMLDVPLVHY
jgi:hypothetical protein